MTTKTSLQISLWTLFVVLTLVAVAVAAIKVESPIIVFLFIGIWIIGLGATGFVFFTALNAVINRQAEPLGRLSLIAWRSMIGFAFLFTAFHLFTWAYDSVTYFDRITIDHRYQCFREALEHSDYPEAYGFMSSSYRRAKTLEQFQEEFDAGTLPRLSPGRSLRIFGARARLYPYSGGLLSFRSGPDFHWVREQDEWFLTGEVDQYVD